VNYQGGTESRSRRLGQRLAKGLRVRKGGESDTGLPEKPISTAGDRPENSNVEDGGLNFPAGEKGAQLGLDFPIAGHQEADQSIVRSFEDVHAKLRT
jgi:hypothetical protein